MVDLGAIDIERARDHGMPSYNQLRQAYGLPRKTSFRAITGESTDSFPAGSGVDNPNSLTFLSTADINGDPTVVGEADGSTSGIRRSTTAARLRAVYGNVDDVDAFVGMIAEQHATGSEFGELQRAIWTRQFQALRDGDRFFYGNDMGLSWIQSHTGRRHQPQRVPGTRRRPAAGTCRVTYRVATTWTGNLQVELGITNLGNAPVNGWTVQWQFANGQNVTQGWNGTFNQSGPNETVRNASWNAVLGPGATLSGVGFNASFDNVANGIPPNISLNGKRCAVS